MRWRLFWARIARQEVWKSDTQREAAEKIGNLERMRQKYQPTTVTEQANLRIYDLSKSSLVGFIKWILSPNLLTLLATSVCTAILYFPLHLMKIRDAATKPSPETTQSFIVTEDFIDNSLEKVYVDDGSPEAPRGFRVFGG